MLIQLPVETWIEILDWLRRRDLIKKLDKLWDREFTPIVQDWLHKYTRKVSIGRLCAEDDVLSVRSCGPWEEVPIAEVEMPRNITSFERIALSYLDSTLLAFLHRMSPLFHNIHLWIDDDYRQAADELPMRTALRALMPMISSIDSLILDCKLLQFFSTNYSSIMPNMKLLEIGGDFKLDDTDLLIKWLFTRREDGQRRILLLSIFRENPAGFWEKLQERFLDPTRKLASPFFIEMCIDLPNLPLAIENARTGEQLTIKSNLPYAMISNCALNNVNQEWLAKKKEEVRKWDLEEQQQVIHLNSPKIGFADFV